jgi:hypothetical protein
MHSLTQLLFPDETLSFYSVVLTIKESPRWLELKNRHEEATEDLAHLRKRSTEGLLKSAKIQFTLIEERGTHAALHMQKVFFREGAHIR